MMFIAFMQKVRATDWYRECCRYSAAFNWPFGTGAVVAIVLLLAILVGISIV